MSILDKRNILDRIGSIQHVVLELGCGNRKRIKNSIGVDVINYKCVDIVGDAYDVLKRIPNSSVDAIYSHHFFEHVANLGLLMDEQGRVLKVGGYLEVVVPHFSNPYFYSDYTHKNFFGLYSFSYFAKDPLFKRSIPTYNRLFEFELCSVQLIFKSSPPFYFRHGIKLILGKLFNLNNYMKEFYEENLCYIFPCYEIKFLLKKIAKVS